MTAKVGDIVLYKTVVDNKSGEVDLPAIVISVAEVSEEGKEPNVILEVFGSDDEDCIEDVAYGETSGTYRERS